MTNRTRKLLTSLRPMAAVFGLVVAVAGVNASVSSPDVQPVAHSSALSVPEPPADRYELASDDADDPIAQCLITLGWRGVPGDGRSSIAAPWQDIEWCRTITAPLDANTAVPLHDVQAVWSI